MTKGKYWLTKATKKLDHIKENVVNPVPGILGFGFGENKRVEITDRPGYYWVRIRDQLSERVAAYNQGNVAPVYGLPVLITRDTTNKNRWIVLGRDTGRYEAWGSTTYIGRHGDQHSFDPDTPGGDPVWVWGRQFMPLAAVPSGSAGGPNVIIEQGTYWQDYWKHAGGTGTANIISSKPTDGNAKMVLVYLDNAGNPQLEVGTTTFDPSLSGTSQIVPYLPSLPETSGIPIAGIRLVSGTSKITWSNIYDLRSHIVGDGYIPTGTVGHIIASDGANQDNRPVLNFVGDSFTIYNDGTKTNVSGSAAGHIIQEDGTPLTSRPNLNFTSGIIAYDDPITATTIVSGTVAAVSIPETRVPFGDSDSNLTSSQYFWLYGGSEPTLVIGGLGDTANNYRNFALSIIKSDVVGPNDDSIGIWGYGASSIASPGYVPRIASYSAEGQEAFPEYLTDGSLLYNQDFYALATGTSYVGWIRPARFFVEALSDFNDIFNLESRFVWQTLPTGTLSHVDSLELSGRRAKFGGDFAIPTGSSLIPYPSLYYGFPGTNGVYPNGTWRTTRDGDNLEFQRFVTGSVWDTRAIITYEGQVRQKETWHVYGGFQDEDETITVTGSVWAHITNGTNDLWTGLETDGITLSSDILTITNAGDYTGQISITFSALLGKDYQVRLYNITQATQVGYEIGATTTGATNYTNVSLPLYIEANAGDQFRAEIMCTTDGTDPTVRSAVFYIAYLHD